MLTQTLRAALFALEDPDYAAFQRKLLPTLPPETVIGVRTPALRALARQYAKHPELDGFLNSLPHAYFDENQLHAFLLMEERDFARCMAGVERFLPRVDNWATCDQLSPRCFSRHKPELLTHVRCWLASGETYTVRFGVGMLLAHFLDGDFDPRFPAEVAAIRSDEYYVNMMVAWYFAAALAKQYEAALPWIEGRRLDPWTHNKAIQKALESRRVPQDRKALLRDLKVK